MKPDDTDHAALEAARRQLVDCDRRLERYRAALDTGADPKAVSAWIAEVQGARLAAERTLVAAVPAAPMSADDVRTLIDELGDVGKVLADAEPARKADLYIDLGVQLTYRPADDVVVAELSPWASARVGGGT